ncbi:MAG: Hsp20/alpha crystallin family protein [Candidatus Melainabacteria bacterium]|nr:Hsp20/alpha crystallin family protein [Candidatus Melainabacteria bacterium]
MKGAVAIKDESKSSSTPTPVYSKQLPAFRSLQEEVNKIFEEFRHGLHLGPSNTFESFEKLSGVHTKIDVKETDKAVVVTAELPGVDLKDIEVTLKDDALVISGEKKFEKEEKDKGYYKMERSYGSFYRSIPFPCAINRESVDASYKDGLLKVTLPKSQEAINNERKISVNQG